MRIKDILREQGVAENSLREFAPGSDDDGGGDDGFSEETLKRLAAAWYMGNEDPRVERTLMAAGWEIGQDEGYDDEPGVFVVQAGDVNGRSYISWPAHELRQGVAEGAGKNLSVEQLATISDAALDQAYGYGRSAPGKTFGWQANLQSAAQAKKMIDAGVTDIERIADAIHRGWNVTAQKFVQDPDQFADTEKLRAAGKLEAKLDQRAKLMRINYAQLPDAEQEKDRVVARALLQALTGAK